MKKFLLLSFLSITMYTLNAQITHTSFGDGWTIPLNANLAVDIDENGTTDFHINGHHDELGFVPIFAVGCFSSPSYGAYTSFNARELQLHEAGEMIQLNNINLFDYIDDDRGSSYSVTGGPADGWLDKQDVYVGFVVMINGGSNVRNGWIRTAIDIENQLLLIKEWAYTEVQYQGQGGILAGDRGESTSVKTLNDIAGISISPNPASDRVQLKFDYSGSEDLSVVIQNSVGKEVFRTGSTLSNGSTNLNIQTDQWSSGIYFVRFETETAIRTEKLSITR